MDVLDEVLKTSRFWSKNKFGISITQARTPDVCSPPLIQFKVRALPDSLDTGKWLLDSESGICHRQSPDCRDRLSCQDSPT